MLKIAHTLSDGILHLRVDLYSVQNRVYFGEMTFFDSSGYDDFGSEEWNRRLGNWIDLTKLK